MNQSLRDIFTKENMADLVELERRVLALEVHGHQFCLWKNSFAVLFYAEACGGRGAKYQSSPGRENLFK